MHLLINITGIKGDGKQGDSASPQNLKQNKMVHSPKAVSQYAATMLKSGRVKQSPMKEGRQTTSSFHLAENIITQEEKLERRREFLAKRQKAVLIRSNLNYSDSNLLDIKTLLNRETLTSSDPSNLSPSLIG